MHITDWLPTLAAAAGGNVPSNLDGVNQWDPILAPGCLFNVRRDPSESHNLWARASRIATLLTSRLRGLWALQQRRSALNLDIRSYPANFNYVWSPWLTQRSENSSVVNLKVKPLDKKQTDNINLSINFNHRRSGNRKTVVAVVNCDGTAGLRNFLCILNSVF